jgi:hypothetical protein
MKSCHWGVKVMEKQFVIVGVTVLLVCVGLSGCNQISNPLTTDKTLPGGIKVTGDTGDIQIVNYSFIKERTMFYTETWYNYINLSGSISVVTDSIGSPAQENCRVPWDLNITGITSNVSKRKQIYLQYINPDERWWNHESFFGNEPFTLLSDKNVWGWVKSFGSNAIYLQFNKITNVSLDAQPIWHVYAVTKNIGNNFLNYPQIIVNFYNSNGAWLSSVTASDKNKPSGYTWNFDVSYDGEFRNDVSYISFEVKTNL